MWSRLVVLLCVPYVICEQLQLPQGSPCKWGGVMGRCVSIFKCFGAMENVKDKDEPPFQICSYEGTTPIICCTDCDLVEDTRLLLINHNLGVLNKTGTNKAKDKCVEYIHNLYYPCKNFVFEIIKRSHNYKRNCHEYKSETIEWSYIAEGGRDAEREEYPHMALLGYGDSMESADWLCGGSVISERFVLTAAHCEAAPVLGTVKYVALGILKRSDPSELWQRLNVKRFIPHPEYKPPFKYHDIALIETDKDIKFGHVRPACLHVDDQVDKLAEATGWGTLGHKKSLADTLQSVKLSRYSEEECAEKYPPHRHLLQGYNHTTQMCYGDRGDEPKDTCEGDSGGPLQSKDHERCVYTVLGVTSYGRGCGLGRSSGVYTRVRHYVPWIEDIVWASTTQPSASVIRMSEDYNKSS